MNHLIKDKFVSVKEQVTDFPGFQVNIKDFLAPTNAFRNPYDIERKNLLDQVSIYVLFCNTIVILMGRVESGNFSK